ncbi:hypothetical protein Dimus_004088 [Dionaea muscipula]
MQLMKLEELFSLIGQPPILRDGDDMLHWNGDISRRFSVKSLYDRSFSSDSNADMGRIKETDGLLKMWACVALEKLRYHAWEPLEDIHGEIGSWFLRQMTSSAYGVVFLVLLLGVGLGFVDCVLSLSDREPSEADHGEDGLTVRVT